MWRRRILTTLSNKLHLRYLSNAIWEENWVAVVNSCCSNSDSVLIQTLAIHVFPDYLDGEVISGITMAIADVFI